jgi:hypothetical protein
MMLAWLGIAGLVSAKELSFFTDLPVAVVCWHDEKTASLERFNLLASSNNEI